MSLRNRLLLVTVATLGLGLGGLLVAGNVLYARTTTSSVMNLLNTRLEAQIAALDVTPHGIEVRSTLNDDALDSHGWVFNGDVVIEHPTGLPAGLDRLAAALAARTLPARAVGPGDTEMTSRPLRVHGRRVGAVVVSVSSAQFTHLRHVVLAGSATMALLVLLLGRARAAPRAERRSGAGRADGLANDEITGLGHLAGESLVRDGSGCRARSRAHARPSHELRTPLAAIHGHAEFAADPRSTNEEIRAAVNQIGAQTTRMKQTIDALMAYARHETDAPEDGSDLASVCVEFDGVTVTAAKDLPAADAEPALVRHALSPIVENARRHAATRVWIELGRRGGLLSVCVCDDGPGLEPAIAGNVFEPGARAPGTNGGAGLGLPLAQRLARSCGGDLRLLPGSPTRFELTLPIRP